MRERKEDRYNKNKRRKREKRGNESNKQIKSKKIKELVKGRKITGRWKGMTMKYRRNKEKTEKLKT